LGSLAEKLRDEISRFQLRHHKSISDIENGYADMPQRTATPVRSQKTGKELYTQSNEGNIDHDERGYGKF
jgi:hypothetical protein